MQVAIIDVDTDVSGAPVLSASQRSFKGITVEKVTVYYFERFDIKKGAPLRSQRPGTLEAIAAMPEASAAGVRPSRAVPPGLPPAAGIGPHA